MAPYQCPKQVLIWSLPTLAVLISLFWYRRKKPSLKSDPGGKQPLQPSQLLGDESAAVNDDVKSACSKPAAAAVASVNSETVGELLSAIEKARRDFETSQPIAEVNSVDEEEAEAKTSHKVENLPVKDSIVSKKDKSIACEKLNSKVVETTAVLNQTPLVGESVLDQNHIIEDKCVEQIDKVVERSIKEECVDQQKPGTLCKAIEDQIEEQKEVKGDCKVLETILVEGKSIEKSFANCEKEGSLKVSQSAGDSKPVVKEVFTSVNANKQEVSAVNTKRSQSPEIIDLDSSTASTSSIQSGDCFIVEESDSKSDEVIDLTSSTESLAVTDSSNHSEKCGEVVNNTEDSQNEKSKLKMALDLKQQEQHANINVDHKLSSLELDASSLHTHEDGERDSANHSPAEIMLESPALRNFSDVHSEGSSDSGKGCSDVATPPASGSSVAGDGDLVAGVYEFIIPQHLVGRLIGRHGAFLQEIRGTTHTNVFIKRHPDTVKLKICAIEGAQADIDSALSMIRQKFPLRRYPSLSLDKVTFVQVAPTCELAPEQFRLQLVEGVNNDVILSSLVSAGHMFLQQPTHPSYQQLAALTQVMNANYRYPDSPFLEEPVKDGVCAAPAMGGWFRAQIINVNDDEKTVDLRFLDYGGYMSCEYTILKKMRYDFLLLPFQAVECYLANVAPVGGPDAVWSEEAKLLVHNLIYGQVLQAQIYDYTEEGIPLIFLYATCGNQVILINQELVARGFAESVTQASDQEVEE